MAFDVQSAGVLRGLQALERAGGAACGGISSHASYVADWLSVEHGCPVAAEAVLSPLHDLAASGRYYRDSGEARGGAATLAYLQVRF
jgi:hypothetical protein